MTNKKTLYIIIVILVFIIVGGAFFFFGTQNKSKSLEQEPLSNVSNNENGNLSLSEQPNKEKYNEYFTGAYLAKLPAGAKFEPFKIIKTNIFSVGEQFCTSLDMKKQIPANTLSSAIYDVNTKGTQSMGGAFPQAIGPGGSVGCGTLPTSIGKYENKIYINDDLVIVLPFEVK